MGDLRNSYFHSIYVIGALGAVLAASPCVAATASQNFSSAQQAARALMTAAESGDTARILKVLGPEAAEIISTNDRVADTRMRETFVAKAKERMAVVPDPKAPGQKILEIGFDRWPLPVPIVHTAAGWHFDVAKGRQAILLRRIGDNELTALDVCRGYVEAQNEYFQRDPTGSGTRQYAQRFISAPGQKDGLYWPSTDPNDESPIAELVANAIAEGYTDKTQPYHGYYFKVLKGQGENAPGGAMSYLQGDAMTRGFALIAWPAEYRKSGVMTFLVDRAGIVYEKDLGPKTAETARLSMVYDPDHTWKPVHGAGVIERTAAARRGSAARIRNVR
jgi:hypothetical protein